MKALKKQLVDPDEGKSATNGPSGKANGKMVGKKRGLNGRKGAEGKKNEPKSKRIK